LYTFAYLYFPVTLLTKKKSSADYKTHTEKIKLKFDNDQELSQKNFILTI
jgi:hypothetical protein